MAALPQQRQFRLMVLAQILLALALTGCGGGEDSGAQETAAGRSNSAPRINGTPPAQVVHGTKYTFAPSVEDADGDSLTFSVTGLPQWASFSAQTGEISGTPGQGDVGDYPGIVVTVSDGSSTASLDPFHVEVVATAMGSALLTWEAPTQHDDGSPLTDLAGYRVYWGMAPDDYTQFATLDNPGLTSYLVEELTAGTWYFAATAFDSGGRESAYSNSASKTIL